MKKIFVAIFSPIVFLIFSIFSKSTCSVCGARFFFFSVIEEALCSKCEERLATKYLEEDA